MQTDLQGSASSANNSLSLVLRQLKPGDNVARLSLGHSDYVPLKNFLKREARKFHEQNITKTWVVIDEEKPAIIVGYVSLICSQIELEQGNEHAVPDFQYIGYPCIKIARLAVDQSLQGQGIGAELISFSISLTRGLVMENVGCRFLVVDAKNASIGFYKKCGFTLLDTPENKNRKCPLMFIDLHKIS